MLVGAALPLWLTACGARSDITGPGVGTSGDASLDAPYVADATADSSSCDEIIATDAKGALALALDGDVVFWGTQDGLVRTRGLDGVTKTLASETSSIDSIAVDALNVYYTITGFVRSVPRAGGATSDVVTNAGQPFAITVEPDGALDYVDYAPIAGEIDQVRSGTKWTMFSGLDTPGGVAANKDRIFATCEYATLNQIGFKAPIIAFSVLGANPVDEMILTMDLHGPKAVTLFDDRVYFIEQTDEQSTLHGGVRSVATYPGPVQIELAMDEHLPIDLAVDSSGVYATASSGPEKGTLYRAHGGVTTELASTDGATYEAVRTSATAIYWTIAWLDGPPADHASVRKICK